MDGIHVTALDAEVLHENLRDRCQAVGRAGSVGDDVVLLGVVHAVVHAHDDGGVLALRRARDDDLLRAGLDVSACELAGLEDARGFHDDLHAQLAPGKVVGVALGKDLHGIAVGNKAVFGDLNRVKGTSMNGIVLEQMRHRRDVAQVVHGDNLDRGIFHHRAERQAPDATETVDAYLDCHANLLSKDYFP